MAQKQRETVREGAVQADDAASEERVAWSGVSHQGEGGAESGAVGLQQVARLGVRRAEVGGLTKRYEPAEVRGGTDTVEVVLLPEGRPPGPMNQPAERA